MVQPDRPKMAIQYGTKKMIFACRVTKARTQTVIIFYTDFFSTATMVT
jgi:hypothetical protein